jgi:Fe-S-cluster containining protein
MPAVPGQECLARTGAAGQPLLRPMNAPASVAQQLCLACGLCCNGVLFKDVELQPGDDAGKLKSLGLPLRNRQSAIGNPQSKLPQPCAALCGDNRCRIYAERPVRCRQFECALFKSVAAGETPVAAALGTIRLARQRAERVRTLLRALGDTDEHVALSLRFKRLRRRIESASPDDATAERYADLTMAVQDLNHLLAQAFYPDAE